MRLLWLFVCVAAVAVAQSVPTCDPTAVRVRKPWSLLSTAEKTLYVAAVGEGMKQGFHHRFAEIHTDPQSEQEAHGCMFIYWHRKFLLGYENMLRSLKPEYACITLPYWDYATLSSTFVSQSCASVNACSPDIIQYLGGNVDANARSRWDRINGATMAGVGCVQRSPFNNFCQSTTAFNANRCMGCIPRNNYNRASVPAEANIGQVFAQILGGSVTGRGGTLSESTRGIQNGVHNQMHNALSSTMSTMAAPADPLFYAHHAQIDLMHRIYFKCVVADASPLKKPVLTAAEKRNANDRRIWTTCAGITQPTQTIYMYSGEAGGTKVSVNDVRNPLYPFFKDLPLQYSAYVDGDDLGKFSYQYQYTGMLADMLTKCKRFVAPRSALFLDEDHSYSVNPDYTDRCVERPRLPCEVNEMSFLDYMSATAGERGWSHKELVQQLEAVVCIHQHECLGQCTDYSDEFKRTFRPSGPPRCKTIVDRLQSKKLFIKLPKWRQVMAKYFPCLSDGSADEHAPDM